ncbi:MAG: hypothetical protein VKJ04_12055 [Vampirovibrionales bacterium]|nr:hypothetical protein [Vampirovibrionales bacterium]
MARTHASYKRRRSSRRSSLLGKLSSYFNPSVQYGVTIISAIALAGFLFSGYLLFQYADSEDLLARGRRQVEQGKVALGAKTLQMLVYKYPTSYEGHLLLGKAYLELDERKKAEQEFRMAASLKNDKNMEDSGADIAMSKIAVAKKDFDKAQDLLLTAMAKAKKGLGPNNVAKSDEQYRDIMALRQALFELYDAWGDDLMAEEAESEDKKLYPDMIAKYERALRYANDYRNEDGVKEKLIEAYTFYAAYLSDHKKDDQAITLMKKSLRYRYLPETLIELASAYERTGNLDEAIVWYRKAFDANPSTISIRLTSVLMKKGRLLLEDKKQEEADRYFEEADQISKRANLPLDQLYPVKISEMQVVSNVDAETGEFMPKVKLRFENSGERSINFLITKVELVSGDEEITQMTQVIASPDKPMLSKNDFEEGGKLKKDAKTWSSITLMPKEKLNVHMFKRGQYKVVVSTAYNEGPEQTWKIQAVQEAKIQKVPETVEGDNPPVPAQPV